MKNMHGTEVVCNADKSDWGRKFRRGGNNVNYSVSGEKVMQEDIVACDGRGCPIRKSCDRWVVWARARDKNSIVRFTTPPLKGTCNWYIKSGIRLEQH